MYTESKEILKRLIMVHPEALSVGELFDDVEYDEKRCNEILDSLAGLGWIKYINHDALITERGIHMLAVMTT